MQNLRIGKFGNAERTVFSPRNTAPNFIGAAGVFQFLKRNSCIRICKIWWAARRNGEKFATNSCVIDANFAHVRSLDARVFGIARASNSTQKSCSIRTLLQRRRPKFWCVARRPCREFATNSRIFWRKNYAIAAPTARFFSAQHGADLHWSCRHLAIFKSE